MKKVTREELLEKAKRPMEISLKLHKLYKGKLEVTPKCCIRDINDFAYWYTPGVSAPCMEIHKDVQKAYEYTNKWNYVGVVSNGTRVLGLGDIGPEAGLPVMEGKALIFKYLGGVDAFPIMLDTKDPLEFIRTVKILQPTFGGINLEDIAQPDCFQILDTLKEECHIPVWHDDQQGTAAVTVAGLINALIIVNKKIEEVKIALIGAGAANIAIARLLVAAGAQAGNIRITDSKGILHPERADAENLKVRFKEKWYWAQHSNKARVTGGMSECIQGTDVLIGLSKPGPDTILPEQVSSMNKDSIVFVCSNPIPEMWPWDAKDAGARIVATGRSDFPNQVNNSLGFPGIFRGTLDIMATAITDNMCLAAANELAAHARSKDLDENMIIPTMDDWEVFPREAAAVGMQAQKDGVARLKLSSEELFQKADTIIKRSREETHILMDKNVIELPKE